MPEQRVKVVNFDACEWPPKLIGYHSKIHSILIIHTRMSTNSENLVKISLVHSEILGRICQFLPYHPKSYNLSPHNLQSYSIKLYFIKFVHNVAKILPFNILKSTLQYSNPFQNVSMPNKGWFTNFALKLVTWLDSEIGLLKIIEIKFLKN